MRGSYCYLPILPARFGAFRAVGALSPASRSRLMPMFDVRSVILKNGETLDAYLIKRAIGISQCWEAGRPVYVDAHDLPLEARTLSGAQPIAFLVDYFRSRGARVVPVTGTEGDRGTDYLQTMRALVAQVGDGACLRLQRDDLESAQILQASIAAVLNVIRLSPEHVDIVLDLRYVGRDSPESLRAMVLEALQVIDSVGNFRNVAVAGSSVPDAMGKRDQGKVRREPRIELQLWTQLLESMVAGYPMPFSDYGIVGALYAPPGKPVQVPARIRYTTPRDHVFRRASRSEHRDLCRQLIESEDFRGSSFSAGDQRLHRSAMGRATPGNPAQWVGYDTNHHLELVSEQAWNLLQSRGLDGRFTLPERSPRPWLQPELLDR